MFGKKPTSSLSSLFGGSSNGNSSSLTQRRNLMGGGDSDMDDDSSDDDDSSALSYKPVRKTTSPSSSSLPTEISIFVLFKRGCTFKPPLGKSSALVDIFHIFNSVDTISPTLHLSDPGKDKSPDNISANDASNKASSPYIAS